MGKITVIAELGINHGGSMDTAKKMIERAKWANADIAKFQFYDPLRVLGKDSPHLAEAKKCQFTWKQHLELKAHCEKVGIEWMVSLFHPEHVPLAEEAGMKRYKIASRAALDTKLRFDIAQTGKPVILSSGLLPEDQKQYLPAIFKNNPLTVLYCVAEYPTEKERLHFEDMLSLKTISQNIGFSSHCPDISAAVDAVRHGATVIEQHVVLDKRQAGCDVSSSITFEDLKRLTDSVNPAVRLVPVLTSSDIEWLRVQRSRPELYKYFRQDAPISEDQQRRWWKSVDKTAVRLFIVENREGERVGYVGFNPYLPRAAKAEFGIFIIPEYQDRGYGALALRQLLQKGFEDFNLSTIYSDVLNYPGENRFGYYKKLGFEAFPPEHQTIRYRKQGKMIPSIKFFMTKDMWRALNGKDFDGGVEPFSSRAAVRLTKV